MLSLFVSFLSYSLMPMFSICRRSSFDGSSFRGRRLQTILEGEFTEDTFICFGMLINMGPLGRSPFKRKPKFLSALVEFFDVLGL